MTPSKKLFGLLTRRERWSLSWRGWLAVLLLLILAGWYGILHLYPFLAVTQRENARVLVVEGWVPEYAIRDAVKEFRSGSYDRVFTTGGPVEGTGRYTNDYNTSASVGATRLRADGLPPDILQMVPCRVMKRNRTYESALALRDWMQEHHLRVSAINVLTEAVHARRSRLLFQEAFGPDVRVGIIAAANPDYDASRWYRYSEGVRDVIGETLAYVYAKFLFFPPKPS